MHGEVREPQGCEHEHNGNRCCHLPEQRAGTGTPEKGLARTAEGSPHACPLAALEQHDDDQKDANQNVDDADEYMQRSNPFIQ